MFISWAAATAYTAPGNIIEYAVAKQTLLHKVHAVPKRQSRPAFVVFIPLVMHLTLSH